MTGLWRLPLQSLDIPTHQSNNLHQVNGKEISINYLHQTEFSPVQDTWARAVNMGYFNTWPGLTEKDISNMSKDKATTKVHPAQIRKNNRSTRTNNGSGEKQTHADPIQEQNNGNTELVLATVYKTHKIHTN